MQLTDRKHNLILKPKTNLLLLHHHHPLSKDTGNDSCQSNSLELNQLDSCHGDSRMMSSLYFQSPSVRLLLLFFASISEAPPCLPDEFDTLQLCIHFVLITVISSIRTSPDLRLTCSPSSGSGQPPSCVRPPGSSDSDS